MSLPYATPAHGKSVFSHGVCPKTTMACSDASYILSYQWADAANACVASLGERVVGKFIDERAGLDAEHCLSTIPDLYAQATGKRVEPHCCVIRLSDEKCALHCAIQEQ